MIKGFRDFLLRGNVVDLAVAVVIGAAFGAVVSSFVAGFLTPLIGAIGGIPDFSKEAFTVNDSKFLWGTFVNALISFVLVSGVIYFLVVVPMSKITDRLKTEQPVDRPTRDCPECESSIPATARRCSFCTSQVSPV